MAIPSLPVVSVTRSDFPDPSAWSIPFFSRQRIIYGESSLNEIFTSKYIFFYNMQGGKVCLLLMNIHAGWWLVESSCFNLCLALCFYESVSTISVPEFRKPALIIIRSWRRICVNVIKIMYMRQFYTKWTKSSALKFSWRGGLISILSVVILNIYLTSEMIVTPSTLRVNDPPEKSWKPKESQNL